MDTRKTVRLGLVAASTIAVAVATTVMPAAAQDETGAGKSIAVITPDYAAQPAAKEAIDLFVSEAKARGYDVKMTDTNSDNAAINGEITTAVAQQVDAIVTAFGTPQEFGEGLANAEADSRNTSSCLLVSSRARQAARFPRISATSSSVFATRRGDSKSTIVSGRPFCDSSRRRRAPGLRGRNPRKSTRSVSRPATVSAVSSAEGPGTASTKWPASTTAATSRAPGSETSGVPASDTSATERFFSRASMTLSMRAASLWACNDVGFWGISK